MKVLDHFSIPYQGLKDGLHDFAFEVDEAFFQQFEKSQFTSGKISVNLNLDKRSGLSIALFDFEGHVRTTCDRCLSEFDMPVDGEYKLHIKFGDPNPDDFEVMFIDPELSIINFAQYIYESICLSVPMITTHEYIEDCDPEVAKRLSGESELDEEEKEENNIWSALKGLDQDNKN